MTETPIANWLDDPTERAAARHRGMAGGIACAVAGGIALLASTAMDWFSVESARRFGSSYSFSRADISMLIELDPGSVNPLVTAFYRFGWLLLLASLVWCTIVSFGVGVRSRVAALITTVACSLWAIYTLVNIVTDSDPAPRLEPGAILTVLASMIVIGVTAFSRPKARP